MALNLKEFFKLDDVIFSREELESPYEIQNHEITDIKERFRD